MKPNIVPRISIYLTLAFFASFGLAEDSSLNHTNTESSEGTAIFALEKLLAENRRHQTRDVLWRAMRIN